MGGEESSWTLEPSDTAVEQAILGMKKGAHLLKCGRRGKPKFCPFRLSMDEKYLIWYSGHGEKMLSLSLVTKITTGQKTANFQRQLQPDKEHQSLSLVYVNGECSLDLICKDKAQADSWFIGLRAVISRCHCSVPHAGLRSHRGIQSCINSPVGYIRRKHNLGVLEDNREFLQVHSLCGSPTQSLSERSDGLSFSSDGFFLSESSLSQLLDAQITDASYVEPYSKKCGNNYACSEFQKIASHRFVAPIYGSRQIEKSDSLKDVLIWGEGVERRHGGMVQRNDNHLGIQGDVLLPKLLESTVMLDVRNISLGARHAALVTKRGEVFCWGEGSGGKLGHKVNMDVSYPKVVEFMIGVHVKAAACGKYQTCALTHSGELYTWGDDKYGAHLASEDQRGIHWLPNKIFGSLDGINIVTVACGEWHTAIVASSGQLFTYGDGTFGVLGHGNIQSVAQPKEVESLKGLWVKSVSCGSWHTAAIVDVFVDRCRCNDVNGKLFTWGDGDKGRLGHAGLEKKLLPTCVAQLADHDFIQVVCGRMLTVALTNTGKVYTMGSLVHGQLGNPQAKDKSITIVEGNLRKEFVKDISSGSYHVAALTLEGRVYTWGKGVNGQLGLGTTEDRNSPTFVEALRDRQVETITCGSNLTAAICLHKSISTNDRSSCSSCRMPFGFTRKRHNCYNCGLLFCHTCSTKKVTNVSLAPNKKRPSRVCDSCFYHLQKVTYSERALEVENHDSWPVLSPGKVISDVKEDRDEPLTPGGNLWLMKQLHVVESLPGQRKTQKSLWEKEKHLEAASLSAGLPRWGHVPCPASFESYYNGNSVHPLDSLSNVLGALNMEQTESNHMLAEEVSRLKAEISRLELQCQTGCQKIHECQQMIEKTWSIAREEAAKRKAANEIIKLLASKLHSMSEKVSAGREVKDGIIVNLPQFATVQEDHPAPVFVQPTHTLSHLLPELSLLKDTGLDSLSSSPVVFSNRLNSIRERKNNSGVQNPEDSGDKASKFEWVEQYEHGVYITFMTLPGGNKELKRVRFSRKRFTQEEAERWWEENQAIVYQKCGIEGYKNSNQNSTRS